MAETFGGAGPAAGYAVPVRGAAGGYPEYEKMYDFRLEVVYVFPESVRALVERGYVIEAVGGDPDGGGVGRPSSYYPRSRLPDSAANARSMARPSGVISGWNCVPYARPLRWATIS